MWKWLGELTPAQATIIGTAFGAILGFGTLAAGALLNAHLNRKRDLFLHRTQQLNLLRSIVIEIAQISNLIRHQLASFDAYRAFGAEFSIINPSTLAVVYPNNLSNLHLLPPRALIRISPFYIGLWEHEHNVVTHGGERGGSHGELRSFTIGQLQLAHLKDLNERLEALCQQTLEVCWPILQKFEVELEGSANTVRAAP